MKFILENQPHYAIQGYEDDEITVAVVQQNDTAPASTAIKRLSRSFILGAEVLNEDWHHPADVNACRVEDFQLLLDLKPEVVIISTGNSIIFPPANALQAFYERNIGVEVMTTGAACRTFNVLASEYRKVIAGFMLPSS